MSSRVPALTSDRPGIASTLERIGEPQLPQKWRHTALPLSPLSVKTLVSPVWT